MNGTMKNIKQGGMSIAVLMAIAVLLTACGGGGGGTASSGGITGTGVVVKGVMTKGSVKVAGVAYDDSMATITKDDDLSDSAELKDGMVVLLKGTRNSDGLTGTAELIEAENEVQGTVTDLDEVGSPPSFKVLNQLIYTDDQTIFDITNSPPDDITDMADGQFVEVHGQRDANGNIHATRVELIDPAGELDEVKGIVRNLNSGAQTFEVGIAPNHIVIDTTTTPAQFEPAGQSFSDLQEGITLVEVKGSESGGTLIASVVQFEDLEDDEFEPAEGQEVELEGFVSGFTSHPGDFNIDGVPVTTTASTEFENGSKLDLQDNVKVEAEGHISGGDFIVDEIEFKRGRVRINAVSSAVTSSTLSLDVNGETLDVQITDLTEIDSGLLPLQAGLPYEARGFQDSSGTLIAERIESGQSDKLELQGKAVDKDTVLKTVTLLEVPWSQVIDLTTVVEFKGDDDKILPNVDAFLALITPDKTIVEVTDEGSPPDPPDGNWDQAEIED